MRLRTHICSVTDSSGRLWCGTDLVMKSAPMVARYPVVKRPEMYCGVVSRSAQPKTMTAHLIAKTGLAHARRTDDNDLDRAHARRRRPASTWESSRSPVAALSHSARRRSGVRGLASPPKALSWVFHQDNFGNAGSVGPHARGRTTDHNYQLSPAVNNYRRCGIYHLFIIYGIPH